MRRLRSVTARLGRRGAVLLALGAVWIVYGWAIGTVPHSTGALGLLDRVPTDVWVGMWLVCGAVGIGHCAVPRARDGLGFTFLVIPPALWSFGLWWAWIVHLLPVDLPGNPLGWAAAIIWTGITVVVVTVAGWIEPTR